MPIDERRATRGHDPADIDLEVFARELLGEGRAAEAVELLATLARSFVLHQPGRALPCLCGPCGSVAFEAETEAGRFVRDFVVVRGWVLSYWVPAEVGAPAARRRLRPSMRAALGEQIEALARPKKLTRSTPQPGPPAGARP